MATQFNYYLLIIGLGWSFNTPPSIYMLTLHPLTGAPETILAGMRTFWRHSCHSLQLLDNWNSTPQEIRISPELSCSEKEKAGSLVLAKEGFSHRCDNLSNFLTGETRSQSNDRLMVDGTTPWPDRRKIMHMSCLLFKLKHLIKTWRWRWRRCQWTSFLLILM